MNLRNILSAFAATLIAAHIYGQTSISGRIVEKGNSQPIAFANVALFQQKDSSLVSGTVTDEQGKYLFADARANNYYIQISCIGYETFIVSDIIANKTTKNLNLGDSQIEVSSTFLNDVSVSAQKSLSTNSIDRKVYNVDADILSNSASVSDILQNIPSVSVDVDGSVSLRGSSNITYFINGKPSSLLNKNSATALQQIPSSNIERIEVITNPSAKYKPDGVGGIINIVLKKEKQDGFNGMLMANAGNKSRYNAGISLNYNTGKCNIYGNYGIKRNNSPRFSSDYRINRDAQMNAINYYNSESTSASKPFSHFGSAGLEYQMNDNNTFEISANADFQTMHRLQSTSSTWKNPENIITTDYITDRVNDENEMEWETSALWEHRFEKEDHTLQFELNVSGYDESEENRYTENYTVPDGNTDLSNVFISKRGPKAEFYAEYALPINEDAEFEAGYVLEAFKDKIVYFGEDYDQNTGSWIKDANKSNEFVCQQQIHTVYSTFSQSFDKLSVMAGLRAEQVLINSNLLTLDSVVPNNYFKIYPTVHLSYELNDYQEIQLNYSKRIKRADPDEMNPFPEYGDPRNMEAGNPLVKPEQIHSVELGYHLKKKAFSILPCIYYRYKYDGFAEIREFVNDTVMLSSFTNLSKSEFTGMELIVSSDIGKLVSLNFSANGYYTKIDASNIGYSDSKSAFSWDSKLGANFNVTKSTFFQVNSFYKSSRINAQGENAASFHTNLGLRQELWKNKASLIVTVSDVFNSLKKEYYIDTPELWQKSTRKRDSQIVYVGFTYRFGSSLKKQKEDLKFDDSI